jgi:class I fructose-bisphosphate aldolase
MEKSIAEYLGDEADSLLNYTCTGVTKDMLVEPTACVVDKVFAGSDRNNRVLGNLAWLFGNGRLGGTGYLSILPVDQGLEHTAGASFGPSPAYFNPEGIVELAVKGGCNAVASSVGVLGLVSRRYAHKIPLIVKLNHNELLTMVDGKNRYDQRMFATVEQAWDMGAAAVGATIYYGSPESGRQIEQVSEAFATAHELGLATVLWCYLRHSGFKTEKADYHLSADMTGQANHLGVTIEADIIKQKQAVCNGGFKALGIGKTHPSMYEDLCSEHPIDLCRYQVVNCYAGRIPMINSGGASGENDFAQAVRTAVINKRAGGWGLISGRKAFQRPMAEGVKLLNTIQDVYLDESVGLA